jgi:DNA-binding NarL/FixJ family response regulator
MSKNVSATSPEVAAPRVVARKNVAPKVAPLSIAGPARRLVKLTSRQAQILRAMVWGRTAEEIGDWLKISSRTVEIHRSQLMHRLGARNAADATRIALTSGFDFRPEPGDIEESIDTPIDFVLFDDEDSDRMSLEPAASREGYRPSPRRRVLVDARVRTIGFNDPDYPERMEWMRAWAEVEGEYIYTPWDTRMLSQFESSFDVLMVHGSDARRIANTLRKFRKVYPGKIMMALMNGATAVLRAAVYRAGADAVYTLNSDAEEAAAWLSRAISRQAVQDRLLDQKAGLDKAQSSSLVKLIGEKRLTRFERRALSILEEAKGRPVTYSSLAAARNNGDPAGSMKSMQVYVSRLNAKLNGFPRLENIRGCGYRLSEAALVEALDYWRQCEDERSEAVEFAQA